MNSIVQNYYPSLREYQALRTQMMQILTDADLLYAPQGNQTLGELCREIGEIQHAYVHSFRIFSQNFTYRHKQPGLDKSVAKLKGWFEKLDADLLEVVSALSEETIETRKIERGFEVTPQAQLEIYKEALLIFYGKASVYLKALGKELPEQWRAWIA
jgi:hypothetical protein